MLRRIGSLASCVIALAAFAATTHAQSTLTAKATGLQPAASSAGPESDRLKDGLVGPVRRVRTEVAKLSSESGKMLEGKHAVLEVASYDLKGNKVENQYFPIAGGSLTGKEVYKYDDKGNISEMTVVSDNGSLLSKEVYKYEYDSIGNWTRMTTSVAVIEAGKITFEPTEVTYRAILAGFTVREIPIVFADRTAGTSKMSSRIALEAMLLVPVMKRSATAALARARRERPPR